jgi:hypothetical protein
MIQIALLVNINQSSIVGSIVKDIAVINRTWILEIKDARFFFRNGTRLTNGKASILAGGVDITIYRYAYNTRDNEVMTTGTTLF